MKSPRPKCKTPGEGGGEKKKKDKDKSSSRGEKASEKVGTVRGLEGKPEVESSNKKFLAPAAVSAGEFSGNVYRLTEEFRQGGGGGKAPTTRAHPATVPRFQSARLKKKKKKKPFPNCSAPPTPSPGKKKKGGGGGSDWSSQFQPAKVSRLIAILGLRKLLKRDLIASNVQQKWGVRVSVSLRAWLGLARARSLRLSPSLSQQRPGVAARSGSLSLPR